MTVQISVSLASVPLIDIKHTIEILNTSAVQMLHFDIEDGFFVPTMTFGTKIIGDLRSYSHLLFEAHLMVMEPEKIIRDLIKMGADRIIVHWEVCSSPYRTLSLIKENGATSGLAFNPRTKIPDLNELLHVLDFVDVLSTDPYDVNGIFIPETVNKMVINKRVNNDQIAWEIDGGLNPSNIRGVIKNNANVIVVGRHIFNDGKIIDNIRFLID